MDTMEMITKALEAVVEQKVAEKATTVDIESVLKFIHNASSEDIDKIFDAVSDTEQGDARLHDFYQDKLENDDSVINKDDLDVDMVDDCGLLEDCFERYLDDANDLREVAKNIIDRI